MESHWPAKFKLDPPQQRQAKWDALIEHILDLAEARLYGGPQPVMTEECARERQPVPTSEREAAGA